MEQDDSGCVGCPCGPVEDLDAVRLDSCYAGGGRHYVGFLVRVEVGGKLLGFGGVSVLPDLCEVPRVPSRDVSFCCCS